MAGRLLGFWVRIPPEAWMSVCCECLVLSGRGLCDELITRQEESYRLWCIVVCDLETSWMRMPWPTKREGRGGGGCCVRNKQTNKQTNNVEILIFNKFTRYLHQRCKDNAEQLQNTWTFDICLLGYYIAQCALDTERQTLLVVTKIYLSCSWERFVLHVFLVCST
jgi:hypothetical protein